MKKKDEKNGSHKTKIKKSSESARNLKREEDLEDIHLPDELESILSDPDIPQDKKITILRGAMSMSILRSSAFSGPLPPPEILKGYNEIIENGAERIIRMAENQSTHRMGLENYAIKEELRQSRWGQVFGFILGVIGMGLATVLGLYGHEVVAGIFGSTTIIGLVTVFVIGRRAQRSNQENS